MIRDKVHLGVRNDAIRIEAGELGLPRAAGGKATEVWLVAESADAETAAGAGAEGGLPFMLSLPGTICHRAGERRTPRRFPGSNDS